MRESCLKQWWVNLKSTRELLLQRIADIRSRVSTATAAEAYAQLRRMNKRQKVSYQIPRNAAVQILQDHHGTDSDYYGVHSEDLADELCETGIFSHDDDVTVIGYEGGM